MRTKGEQRRRSGSSRSSQLAEFLDYHQLRQVLIKLVVRLSVDKTRICGSKSRLGEYLSEGELRFLVRGCYMVLEKMTAICGA